MNLTDKQKKDKKFTDYYNRYYSEILYHVTIKMNSDIEAIDIAGDVFLKVYKYLETFDGSKAQFNTWLYKVTNNQIIDFYRSKVNSCNSRKTNISDFVDSEGEETFQIIADNEANEDIESKELMNNIVKAFSTLKPKYQKVARLLFLEQKKYDEIAEICDIPMGNVKVMINRCRKMLQAQLQSQKVEYSL